MDKIMDIEDFLNEPEPYLEEEDDYVLISVYLLIIYYTNEKTDLKDEDIASKLNTLIKKYIEIKDVIIDLSKIAEMDHEFVKESFSVFVVNGLLTRKKSNLYFAGIAYKEMKVIVDVCESLSLLGENFNLIFDHKNNYSIN